MNQPIEELSRTQEALASFAVEFAPKLLAAGLILALGFFATGWAARLLRKALAVKPWVAVGDFAAASGEINLALVQAFRGHGIAIPPPRHEIRLLPSASA